MFPRDFIEGFVKGYSAADQVKIQKDLKIVEQVTFDAAKPNTGESAAPEYLATAGGPGSAKSTTLEAFLKSNELDHFVYADPDQVSLKNMNFTYRKSLTNCDFAEAKSNHEALRKAYDKWRGASNYICHEILQTAFGGKYSVAHGTTSTSPHIGSLYQKVKALGYRVTLLLCYSEDETRKKAIERREKEQAFVQTDPKEVISKGSDFPRRFDIYFDHADEILFYWNNELDHGKLPTACARFVKSGGSSSLTVLNEVDWNNFCKKYLHDIKQHDIKICHSFASLMPKKLQILENAVAKFGKEFVYYTHPDVQATAHQVGTPFKDSWTKILCETGVIERPESIERYTELERTLSSLYCFELNREEKTYAAFTEAQNAVPHDKLSEENYIALCADLKKTLDGNKDASDVLACLITYSDLGKSPATRALAKSSGIDSSLDTDDLILEILKLDDDKVIKIMPSFTKLSAEAKIMLRTAYPMMTACLGHLYFLEGGPKTLETIAKALQEIHPAKRKELLDLVFLAQFYDGVGSQGQLNIAGSVTCTNNFYKGYMLIRATLHDLERRLVATNDVEKSVTESLEVYLLERAKWLRLDASLFQKKEDYEFVLRLACTIRIFDPEVAKALVDAFYKLAPDYRVLLAEQLSFDSKKGINSFARSPHYIATAAQNISRESFSKKDISHAIDEALKAEICLAMLIKEIVDKHPDAVANTRMPMSFGKLAFRASEPGFCNPKEFDATLARWAFPRPQLTGAIKNLVFDLGHVFIKIDTTRLTVFRAFSELAKKHGKNLSTAEVGLIFNEKATDEVVVAFHRGKISIPEFRKYISEKLGLPNISENEFDQAFTASILADPEEVKQRLAYLDGLINQGYNIYLLSNNNEIHRIHTKSHYDGMNWGKYFFKQYYSNETGLYKPDAAGFMQILKENQLKASETLFFDDVMKYVDAAWQHGIRARQFTVKRPMSDIKLIIDAIAKNENSGVLVSRVSSLSLFAAAKFKQLLVSEERSHTKAASPEVEEKQYSKNIKVGN